MTANKKQTDAASDSNGSGVSDGAKRRWDARVQAEIDEHMHGAIARVEVEERRVRERLEQQLQRAQATHDKRSHLKGGRERSLSAAKTLFLDKGYVSTSMQEIADAAGLRKASIYYHFADKEALFSEIVLGEIDASWSRLQELIAADGPLKPALLAIAEDQFTMTTSDLGRLAMDFRKFVSEDRHAGVHAKLQETVSASAELFRRGVARGEIAPIDPRVAALLFFHMVASWTFHGLEDPSLLPPDPATGATLVVNVLMNGLTSGLE